MELVYVLSRDLPGKLPLARDTQYAIELVSGASFLNLSHHSIELIKHTELEQQADESSLEIKQQCLFPIDTHIYEDKFGCEVVTRNMDQIEGVTIYGRSVSDDLGDTVMREPHILHIVNFSFLMV